METEKLAVLLDVLEDGSLSAAAERLGYTPSGISRLIASLEEETGFALLHRGRRGVRATAECERLLPHMRRILSAQEQYRQEAEAIVGLESGQLCIGSSYGSYYRTLARLVAGFCREHPGIRAELVEGTSSELAAAIQEGRGDLCVISRREGDFDWIGLRRDQLVAVLPVGHPLAGAPAFPVERFGREPFIEILPGKETDNSRLFAALHLNQEVRYTCADSYAALSLVEAGLGVTLVNAALLEGWQGRAVTLPLDPPQELELGIAIPSLPTASPAARKFIAYTRAALGREETL